MKTSSLFWGAFFIALGGLFLADNISSLTFSWDVIIKLWPLILVFWGIGFLFKETAFKWIISGCNGLLFAYVVFAGYKTATDFTWDDNDDGNSYSVHHYVRPYSDNLDSAQIRIKAGIGEFYLQDVSPELFEANIDGVFQNYSFDYDTKKNSESIDLSLDEGNIKVHWDDFKNKVNVKLNPNPIWDINFEISAAHIDMDLSKYNIGSFKLESGASDINLKLGTKTPQSRVKIDAAASSLKLGVPKEASCEILTDTELSVKNIKGFYKAGDNVYRSENYNKDGAKKITVELESALSSIKVDTY